MNWTIVAIALQALVLGGIAQAPEPPSPEQQLVKLLNVERQKLRLPALQWNANVAEAARAHTQKLASHRALSHQFAGEPELANRLGTAGARFSAAAENVALADDPEEAHLALMNSPGHRANILNPEYNAVGIAVAKVEKQLYVTEDFAHVVPSYSEQEFRERVIAAFNRLRLAHRLGPIDSHPDSRLDQEACTGNMDPQWALQGVNNATRATIFTAVEPNDLPSAMDKIASDVALRRMNIGVCFRQDENHQFSKFWVIAAFSQFK
jgi:uncharacterized protein YkwD